MSASRIVVVTDSTHAVLAALQTELSAEQLGSVVASAATLGDMSPSALVHSLLARVSAGAAAFSLTPYARTQSPDGWADGQVVHFLAPGEILLSPPIQAAAAAGQGGLALTPFPPTVAAAGAAEKALAAAAWAELAAALPALHSVTLERDDISEDGWVLSTDAGATATIPAMWDFSYFTELNWDEDDQDEEEGEQLTETESFARVVQMIHRRFDGDPSAPISTASLQAEWFEHMQHLLRSITGTTHSRAFLRPAPTHA